MEIQIQSNSFSTKSTFHHISFLGSFQYTLFEVQNEILFKKYFLKEETNQTEKKFMIVRHSLFITLQYVGIEFIIPNIYFKGILTG